jgi:hypothetical protein
LLASVAGLDAPMLMNQQHTPAFMEHHLVLDSGLVSAATKSDPYLSYSKYLIIGCSPVIIQCWNY